MHQGILVWIIVFWQGLTSFLGFGGVSETIISPVPQPVWSMKLVNENASDQELARLHDLGITIISGEWGMDEADAAEALILLDRAQQHQLMVVINFSDGAAWGYAENGTDGSNQEPVWQREKMQRYVQQIKHHPAIFGYDISNEAGENFPNGTRFRLTATQLQIAARDVRAADPGRPIMMRMHYWDEDDGDFGDQNPFPRDVADIVMLNLYSNYTLDGRTPYLPSMVEQSGQQLVDKIHAVDSNARVWLALAAFQEAPQFLRPTAADIQRDISAALTIRGIENIGFFGWGPERYSTQGKNWYLPKDGPELLTIIASFTRRQ